ncbi:hypothetical protein DUI87_22984 [Hirundo rustica rustica]|uniref:Envelope glycoprotein n=1 Tax=Hirundo rustica rustica TaxID=333673 RepID=A0A3M0JH96_HIRRU|nr:hypothetical protein DUI87_22984 [Hirundo rustica rustica]
MASTKVVSPRPRNSHPILGICIALYIACLPIAGWVIPQPKANVWATLARAMGQDHICLSAASADNPLSTCLVGIPFKPEEFPQGLLQAQRMANQDKPFRPTLIKNPLFLWSFFIRTLSQASAFPAELELLGSVNATFCVKFVYFPPKGQESLYHRIHASTNMPRGWCKNTVEVDVPTNLETRPLALPKGTFFICGDKAWSGIPPHHIGGPCTLGQLSLFTPNKTTLANWHTKIASNSARQKRDLRAMDPDCDSEIVHWSKGKGVAVTIFLPWVAIAKTLGELAHLECWVAKQANLTTDALTNLLSDEETTRQATLQNRAAIDYLLLLHGHRCEEFEGLCCFNLTSRAENIHDSIRQMKEMVANIKRETDDWLGGLFGNWGLSGWVTSIIKTILLCLFVLMLVIIAFGLLKRMLYNLVSTTHSPTINRLRAPSRDLGEDDELELEERPGTPEDEDGRNPDLEEHGLGYPTQHEWFAESYPQSEYLPPPFQFRSF